MSADRLFLEIIRGEWFLDTTNIYSYVPLLQNYLEGKTVYNKPELSSITQVINSSGKVANEKEEGYAFISMSGVLTRFGDICTYGAEDYMSMLMDVEEDPKLKGTVLFLNGPGGSVESLTPILEMKKAKTKPIVGLINCAASMHYWAAIELCDKLIAENNITSRVGSVGVMCTFLDFKEKYEKEGIKIHEIYPPESEHKNQAFRKAMEGDYDQIKEEELTPMAKEFQNAVRRNRPNLKEEVGVLTGKMFRPDEALANGMIDVVGGNKLSAIQMIDILNETNLIR